MNLGICSAAILAVLLGLASSGAAAQEKFKNAIYEPYVIALIAILDEWNQKKLKLNKTDFESEFAERTNKLETIQTQKRDDLEKYIPVKKVRERWKQLPDVLQSDVPLTVGAQLMLIGALYDKLHSIKTNARPTRDDLVKLLGTSFYLTLGSSQIERSWFQPMPKRFDGAKGCGAGARDCLRYPKLAKKV